MATSSVHAPGKPVVSHSDDHSNDAAHVRKHLIGYSIVGGVLFVGTALTVALSYVNFDKMFSGHGWNIIIALLVATGKSALVAAIFMHLKGERIMVWRLVLFTTIFAAGLFLLTLLHHVDPIMGSVYSRH